MDTGGKAGRTAGGTEEERNVVKEEEGILTPKTRRRGTYP